MRHRSDCFNSSEVDNKPTAREPEPVVRLAIVIGAAVAIAVSCSRVGDDWFPKLPDAAAPDANDFLPDAGPVDAVITPDGAADADTAAP
jgi:hypothetical protein